VFCTVFEEIDRLLPEVRTLAEVHLLSRLVEGVLSKHADVEQNLAFAALDQALAEKGQLKQLNQDHKEINSSLRNAVLATDFTTAVRLLKTGLKASREHFKREEESVFPLFDQLLSPETLTALADQNSSSATPIYTQTP
jgi:hemerythrin-like domain-containing protein